MLKFNYKLTVRERVTAKCVRHPRYNPEKEDRAGIKGGCSTCWNLYDLQDARIKLDAAVHEFVRRAGPWARTREPRRCKSKDATSAPVESPEVVP